MEDRKPIIAPALKNQGVVSLEKGKIPPQAVDLEEAVLGAMLIDKKGVDEVIDILQIDAFYKEAHQHIFEAIHQLFESSEPIDLLTVSSQLRKNETLEKVGGDFYLVQLSKKVSTSAHIEFHARIILQKYIQRSLIKISNEIIESSFKDSIDVFDLLDEAESGLFEVAEGNIRKSFEEMRSVVKKAIDYIDKARSNDSGVSGIPSGFAELDKVTGGWQRSDMIVLAARPGMGKTAFVLTMCRNVAVDEGIPCAVFSLEMSSVQLVQRLIAAETEIDSDKFRKGNLEDHEYQQLHDRIGRLSKAPLFIDDTPGLNVFELRAKCRRMKQQHGIDMVVIDYLQLMQGGSINGGNREQEISSISRSIKSIAKELDIPIIALSQLSRMVETRGGDKRPMLSDLRESGAIEQDADLVSFIYRPEYYGFTEHEDGLDTKGLAEFIIAKHRHGALGTVNMKFIARLAKFADYNTFADAGFESLSPNTAFADGGTITRGSKMNDDVEDEGESPF